MAGLEQHNQKAHTEHYETYAFKESAGESVSNVGYINT